MKRRPTSCVGGSRTRVLSSSSSSRLPAWAGGALAVAAMAGLFGPSRALADTWDGGGADNNWTNGLNWLDDSAPASGDPLVFAGATRLTPTNDNAAGTFTAGSITFDAGSGSFTVGGAGILLTGDITNNSGVAQALNFAGVPTTVNTNFTYTTGGLVLEGATSNVSNTAGGTLSLGQVTLGGSRTTANVSTLNINSGGISASGLTVQSDAAGAHTINVAAGRTFNVNGNVYIGSPTTAAGDGILSTNLNVTGTGSLVTGGGNFFVGLGNQNFGGGDRNTVRVDLRTLSNFTYSTGTTGTGLFGVGWQTRPDSELRLSNTANTIVADVIGIGNSGRTGTDASPNNSGNTARMFLGGGTNVINADNINIGAVKGAGSIEWDPAVTTGSLTIAGQDAAGGARANITLSNQSSATGEDEASFLSLAGHSVNILANTVQVGRMGGATGGTPAGTVTFDQGTFDVNNLQIAVNNSGSAANGVTGTFTMGGGSLTVNTGGSFIIGNDVNGTASGPTNGTFNLNAGTVTTNVAITRAVNGGVAGDAAVLNVAGGTLNMTGKNIGSAATPLTAVNISGGTLDNAARIHANAITITNTPTINGTPVYVLSGGGTLSSPGLTLGSGRGIEGGLAATPATVAGAVTANAGGYIDPGAPGIAGAITFNDPLTLNNGSTVMIDLSDSPAGTNDVLNAAGGLSLGGTVNLSIGNTLATSATVGQTYTLMSYAGTLTGNESNLVASDGTRGKVYTVVPTGTTPGSIQVSVGAGSGALSLTWVGNGGDTWQVASGPNNWASGGPQQFFNQDTVTFDNTSTNVNAVQLVGSIQPAAVTVNATRNYTFAGTGSIGGTTTLTKSGTGSLTINTANTYSGGTTLNAGTLNVGSTTALGTGLLTINGGTIDNSSAAAMTLAGNIPQTWGGSFTFTGSKDLNLGAGAVTLESNPTVTVTAGTLTVGGAIVSGTGGNSLTKNGAGTLVLNGNSSYAGTTTVNAGIVTVAATTPTLSSLGALSGGDVIVNSGGVVNLGGTAGNNAINFGSKLFRISGNGGGLGAITNRDFAADPTGATGDIQQFNSLQRVTLDADASIGTPQAPADAAFSTTSGRIDIRAAEPTDGISNTGELNLNGHNLTKIGNGFFGLVNTNVTGTGDIVVPAGTLSLEGTTRLLDDGSSRVRIGDGSMFQVWNLDRVVPLGNFPAGSNVTRPIIMGAGTPTSQTFFSSGSGGLSTLGSAITLQSNMTIRPTHANNNHQNVTFIGNISEDATPRKITKANVGVVTLSGNNTFTGGFAIDAGTIITGAAPTVTTATLQLGSATALHPSNVVSFGPATGYTSLFQVNGISATVGGLNTTSAAGTSTIENASATATPATLTVSNTGSHAFGGVIQDGTGGGTLAIAKIGAGTQALGGANTYTGGTSVSGGTLVAANADAFASGVLSVSGTGTAQLQASLPKAMTLTAITAAGSGKVDVTNNAMVIKGMTDAQVRTQLQSGYNGGAWNGVTGIVSSAVNSSTSVGYASNTSLGLTEFKGVSGLSPSDVILKYTYAGDANLDGKVDIGDLGLLAGAWQQLSGKVWFDGDFTYDGAVNIGDLGLLAGNWQKGTVGNPNPPLMDFNTALAQFSAFDGVVVPEPTSLALLGLGGLAVLGRRRRARQN